MKEAKPLSFEREKFSLGYFGMGLENEARSKLWYDS